MQALPRLLAVSLLFPTVAALAMNTCGGSSGRDAGISDAGPADAGPPPTPEVRMDYAGDAFYGAPFPDEHLRRPDGSIDMSRLPNLGTSQVMGQIVGALEGLPGFGLSSAVFFGLTVPADPASLPSLEGSLEPGASAFLIDVDEGEHRGERFPVVARFVEDGGPHGDRNLVGLLPLGGRPLRPGRRYAAALTSDLRTASGVPFEVAGSLRLLLEGSRPEGLSAGAHAEIGAALTALGELGVRPDRLIGLAVFRTQDPTEEMGRAVAGVLAGPMPSLASPPELSEVFDGYCAYRATIRMPVFQAGEPPYQAGGGAWVFDAEGRLVRQIEQDAEIWITVPRAAMPEGGYPTAVLIRTGAGNVGSRPLVERGRRDAEGVYFEAGSGPAREFARVGYVGVSVDGPHGGIRNLTGADEQFLIFNLSNPEALRDNIRQSALEIAMLPPILEGVSFSVSDCPGAGAAGAGGDLALDTTTMALMGHSMGATIAPLVMPFQPRYHGVILSGAGGSWIENIVHKRAPIEARPLAEILFGYAVRGYRITEHDPGLTLLQWAGESADPQVYAPLLSQAPPEQAQHVLVFQGIVDNYILPPIANSLNLAFALDLAGEPLDNTGDPRLEGFTPLVDLLPLAHASQQSYPVIGNRAEGRATALVVQHPEDGVEDGHEVAFQTEGPKNQYRCFLATLREGVPRIGDPSTGACP